MILLLSFMLTALSCTSSDNGNSEEKPSSDTTASTETSAEESDTPVLIAPNFDDIDGDGATIGVLLAMPELLYQYYPEESGDSFKDSIYYRDRDIEEELNIDFNYILIDAFDKIYKNVSQSVLAGDDLINIINSHTFHGVTEMLSSGCVVDFNTIPNIDMSNIWWNQSLADTMTVNGKLMFAASDYVMPQATGMLLNRDMVEAFSLEDPYDLVNDGLWTIDKMSELANSVYADLDGDGIYGAEDRYGIGAHLCFRWASFLYAGGLHVIELDGDGHAQLALNNERMYTLVEKLNALVNHSNASYKPENFNVSADADSPQGKAVRNSFSEGKSLMLVESIGFSLNIYRDTDVNYGIIPMPKLYESDEYCTNSWEGLIAVPITVDDLGLTGAVLELLAYKNRADVFPIYYKSLLGEKIARDKESVKMLDLIFASVTYDFGISLIGYNNFSYAVAKMLRSNTTDFASYYAANEATVQAKIDKVYDSVK